MRTFSLFVAALAVSSAARAQPAPAARRCAPDEARAVAALGEAATAAREADDHARAAALARAALAVCPSAALYYFAAYEALRAGAYEHARQDAEACVREAEGDAARRDLAFECRLVLDRVAAAGRVRAAADRDGLPPPRARAPGT